MHETIRTEKRALEEIRQRSTVWQGVLMDCDVHVTSAKLSDWTDVRRAFSAEPPERAILGSSIDETTRSVYHHFQKCTLGQLVRIADRIKVPNVLFVCTGNSDRSPTAEELFDKWDGKWKAKSAGIHPSSGRTPLTEKLTAWADLILVMQLEHKDFISARLRNDKDKVRMLDIPDIYQRRDTRLIEELKRKVTPILEIWEVMQKFAGLCALPYHEARYVRVLFGIEDRRAKNYSKLFGIAPSRYEAWAQLDRVRRKAKYAETASQARHVFEQQFELSLQDLVILFKNAGWKGKGVGGPPWEKIASAVIELSVALDKGSLGNARDILSQLMKMRHNSGIVCDKLRDLDQALATKKHAGQA